MGVTAPSPATQRPVCEYEEPCNCGEGDVRCQAAARFAVRRADTDPSFIPFDACEGHLSEAVLIMADGNSEIPLLVTIYWDQT